MEKILLASDIDGTLTGNKPDLAIFNMVFEALRKKRGHKLVFATGRSQAYYEELRREEDLLQPDALIASVGTEIYVGSGLVSDWPNPKAWDRQKISDELRGIAHLREQPDHAQRKFKASYYVDNPGAVDIVRHCLREAGVEIVYSGEKHLDVVPSGVSKGSAVAHLIDRWDFDEARVYAAGNSANDISMLERYNAIVVGADPDVRTWARSVDPQRVFVATAEFAAGLLQGLERYEILETNATN